MRKQVVKQVKAGCTGMVKRGTGRKNCNRFFQKDMPSKGVFSWQKAGFALIELLLVVAIIGVLVALLAAVSNKLKERAPRICQRMAFIPAEIWVIILVILLV